MKSMGKALIAVIAVIVVLVAVGFSSYNGLATMREGVGTAHADIQTQLQRRADLIPNLVGSVKGLTAHEQKIVDSVTEARAALMGAKTIGEQAEANEQLTGALGRLFAITESYPEIKSDAAYISLMDELSGTENRINVARQDYNQVVKEYNSKIVRMPTKIFAGVFGFDKAEYFEAAAGAQDAPDVNGLLGN